MNKTYPSTPLTFFWNKVWNTRKAVFLSLIQKEKYFIETSDIGTGAGLNKICI